MKNQDNSEKMNNMRINQKAREDSHFYETLSLYASLWGRDRASEILYRPYKKQSPSKQLRKKRKAERMARKRNKRK